MTLLLGLTAGTSISQAQAQDVAFNDLDVPGDLIHPDDPDWELQKDENGIQVFFKKVPGSDIKAFMGKTVMSASASSILKAMQTDATCVEWIEGCVRAETLEGALFDNFYQYGVNHLPWPANDRDYVIHITTSATPNNELIKLRLDAVEGIVPKTGNVRLTKMNIRYYLTPIDSSTTEMVWVQHTEPGGYIPGWLVNMLLLDIPFRSLTKLEQVANLPDYREVEFVYDADRNIVGFE